MTDRSDEHDERAAPNTGGPSRLQGRLSVEFGKPLARRALPTGWMAVLSLVGLLALAAACVFGTVWSVRRVVELVRAGSHELTSAMDTEGLRAGVVAALTAMRAACDTGDCDAGLSHVHPSSRAAIGARVRALTPELISRCRSRRGGRAQVLSGGALAEKATRLGLDPARCVLIEGRDVRVIGCETDAPNTTYPFVILSLELAASP